MGGFEIEIFLNWKRSSIVCACVCVEVVDEVTLSLLIAKLDDAICSD
jgi:hypothetical protein